VGGSSARDPIRSFIKRADRNATLPVRLRTTP